MSSAHKPASSNGKAERLLSSLAGIVSAHVVEAPGGRIVEIHILAAPDLHPKQVVRNVESALSAGLGIEIDRRIVSVAQVRSAPAAVENGRHDDEGTLTDDTADMTPSAQSPSGRLEFVRYRARRDAEQCTCDVVLRDRDTEVDGSATGADTAVGRAEAAARAVLHAIERARADLRLVLDGAFISASRGRSFVIVSAHAVFERESVPLVGAALLSRSPEEAAILASLQATNRWSG